MSAMEIVSLCMVTLLILAYAVWALLRKRFFDVEESQKLYRRNIKR